MRGGFLISLDDELYARASDVLKGLGGRTTSGEMGDSMVQLVEGSGRLFTLYERVPAGTEWEVHEGEFVAAYDLELPNMMLVAACPFECRWPDLVSRLVGQIGRASDSPTWILDGDGVVWPAARIDPDSLTL